MTEGWAPSPVEGLCESPPEPLPFAPEQEIRAFLLSRDAGNIVLYSVKGLDTSAAGADGLGAVTGHYLNHWHEALFAPERAGAPIHVHEADGEEAAQRCDVHATFSARHTVGDDLEAIPIPGHTPGATAYLWDTGKDRLLFTGDTVFLDGEEWIAAVLDSSDRDAYVASLELIRSLEFDVLVPWVASRGATTHLARVDPADAYGRIGAIAERVRRGADR